MPDANPAVERTALDLDPARIAAAMDVIDPAFLRSPQYEDQQLDARLGRRVLIKNETANPLRSFKGRGASYFVGTLTGVERVLCVSAGNFGQAIAYACRSAGISATVFLAANANPVSRSRIEGLGAEVYLVDGEDAAIAEQALRYAEATPGSRFVVDGEEPAIAEGAGTIGIELMDDGPIDAVIVPVGDGALINGVACAIKERLPATRVVGVCAAAAPSMAESWRRGVATPMPARTMAAGLAVSDPVPRSVARMRELVDDVLLVEEATLVEAMRLATTTLGTLLEPSGAAGLAALLEHDIKGDRVATILTGSMLRPEHFALLS
jgi:threonine dehydratase